MLELFIEYLKSQTSEAFLKARQAIIDSPNYDPYGMPLEPVEQLLEQERWTDAQEAIYAVMEELILSPRAHLCAGYIAEQLGDDKAAEMERMLAAACVDGILGTGEGTQEKPYLVTRVDEEYDVMQYLGKQMTQQSLTESGGVPMDRIQCSDGSDLWFDISAPLNKQKETYGE